MSVERYNNFSKKYILRLVCSTLVLIILALSCTLPDDFEGMYYDFSIDNLMVVENDQDIFAVNDTLWITTTLPVTFQENGTTITTVSQVASGSIALQELTDFDNPTSISLSEDELLNDKGFTSPSSDRLFIETEKFDGELVNRFGIILKSSGTFILSSGFDFTLSFYYERDPLADITLSTTIRNANDLLQYEFVVEE